MKYLVTGGCGFIGISIINRLLVNKRNEVLNIDKITKVSSPEALTKHKKNKKYKFKKIDICNQKIIISEIKRYKPDVIIHSAAESHVDNSIKSPSKSIKTNFIGTYNLLEAARMINSNRLIFVYISTDEVYGSLNINDLPFKESNKFFPNSPYSASKAGAEHLVRAWHKTYNINTIITNCCNNFGPWQYPEKLIPLTIKNCLLEKKIQIYGSGKNKREWISSEDHAKIIIKLISFKNIGESFNIGSGFEIENIKLVKKICNILNKTNKSKINYLKLINFIEDRKGHDFRYKVNFKKTLKKIGNYQFQKFDDHLEKTILWYLKNRKWLIVK